MRIGSTIILINGYCYQSYNWKMYRPLGELQRVVDSLEEYQCDEISIIRPIREHDTLESFEKDIHCISKINCMTPLSFGGGLREIEQTPLLHNLPIERLIFSTAFIQKDKTLIENYRKLFGNQAIQCLLPFKIEENKLFIFSSLLNKYIPFDAVDMNFIDAYANEIILYDTKNEGENNLFNTNAFEKFQQYLDKLIISGGIGTQTIKIVKKYNLASILIDNKVLHNEYSIKGYKNVSTM